MRRLVARLSFAVLLAGPVSAQAQVTSQDTLAYTTASIRLREKPFANARALAALSQGTADRLYTCSQGWCSVAVSQLTGYLLEEFLSAKAPQAATSQGRGYINSQGSGSHRPHGQPIANRPGGPQPTILELHFTGRKTRKHGSK